MNNLFLIIAFFFYFANELSLTVPHVPDEFCSSMTEGDKIPNLLKGLIFMFASISRFIEKVKSSSKWRNEAMCSFQVWKFGNEGNEKKLLDTENEKTMIYKKDISKWTKIKEMIAEIYAQLGFSEGTYDEHLLTKIDDADKKKKWLEKSQDKNEVITLFLQITDGVIYGRLPNNPFENDSSFVPIGVLLGGEVGKEALENRYGSENVVTVENLEKFVEELKGILKKFLEHFWHRKRNNKNTK